MYRTHLCKDVSTKSADQALMCDGFLSHPKGEGGSKTMDAWKEWEREGKRGRGTLANGGVGWKSVKRRSVELSVLGNRRDPIAA